MKVLNFFGGADIGKSTIAADVFSKLKRKGYKTELVGEYAKWLWYQNATEIVEDQLYLFAEQAHRTKTLAKYGKSGRPISPGRNMKIWRHDCIPEPE